MNKEKNKAASNKGWTLTLSPPPTDIDMKLVKVGKKLGVQKLVITKKKNPAKAHKR